MYFIEQNVARSAWGRVAGSVEAVGGAKSKSNGKTRYLVVTGDPYELIHEASLPTDGGYIRALQCCQGFWLPVIQIFQ